MFIASGQPFKIKYDVFEVFQSNFKCLHDTESALMGFFLDILLAKDSQFFSCGHGISGTVCKTYSVLKWTVIGKDKYSVQRSL